MSQDRCDYHLATWTKDGHAGKQKLHLGIYQCDIDLAIIADSPASRDQNGISIV